MKTTVWYKGQLPPESADQISGFPAGSLGEMKRQGGRIMKITLRELTKQSLLDREEKEACRNMFDKVSVTEALATKTQ